MARAQGRKAAEAEPRKSAVVSLRIEGATRDLIDGAAAQLGQSRTEFMVDSARRHAVDVLLDRALFALPAAAFDRFAQALDEPPAPGPKLRALMGRRRSASA